MPSNGTANTVAERAVIYTRVSTEEQVREGMSLEAQEAACREYCIRAGYSIVRVFVEEGESAKTANRTQLKELLTFCREDHNIGVVVVHKVDRFARLAQDHMQLRSLLAAMGVTLRSVTEPIDDTSAGKFMEHIFAGLAEFDNNVRADRSTKGMRQKLENGYWTFPPPLGYLAGKDKQGNKSIVPDRDRAEHVRWAFEQQGAVSAQGVGDFLHGLDAGAHGLIAPEVQEVGGPGGRVIFPELLKIFFEELGADGLEVVAEQLAQPEILLRGKVLFALQNAPARFLQQRLMTLLGHLA